MKRVRKQGGMTLIEIMLALTIVGLVIAGVTSIFSATSATQKSNRMLSDLQAVRSAVKSLYAGHGSFGAANINPTLIRAKRFPTTFNINETTGVVQHELDTAGTVVVMGATDRFTVTLTNVPAEVCSQVMSQSTGWLSIQGSGAALTQIPVTPDVATANCEGAGGVVGSMIFTSK